MENIRDILFKEFQKALNRELSEKEQSFIEWLAEEHAAEKGKRLTLRI